MFWLTIIFFAGSFLVTVLSVIDILLSEEPLLSKKIQTSIAIISFTVVLATGIIGYYKYIRPDNIGELRPKNSTLVDMSKVYITLGRNPISGYHEIREGDTIQPIGNNIPFIIKISDDGLLISAIIYNSDGTKSVGIYDNEWESFQKIFKPFKHKDYVLEIHDNYGVPVLQLIYINRNTLILGGLFKCENDLSYFYSRLPYPESSIIPIIPLIQYEPSTGSGFSIYGDEASYFTFPNNPIEREALRTEAKKQIQPLFNQHGELIKLIDDIIDGLKINESLQFFKNVQKYKNLNRQQKK